MCWEHFLKFRFRSAEPQTTTPTGVFSPPQRRSVGQRWWAYLKPQQISIAFVFFMKNCDLTFLTRSQKSYRVTEISVDTVLSSNRSVGNFFEDWILTRVKLALQNHFCWITGNHLCDFWELLFNDVGEDHPEPDQLEKRHTSVAAVGNLSENRSFACDVSLSGKERILCLNIVEDVFHPVTVFDKCLISANFCRWRVWRGSSGSELWSECMI